MNVSGLIGHHYVHELFSQQESNSIPIDTQNNGQLNFMTSLKSRYVLYVTTSSSVALLSWGFTSLFVLFFMFREKKKYLKDWVGLWALSTVAKKTQQYFQSWFYDMLLKKEAVHVNWCQNNGCKFLWQAKLRHAFLLLWFF